MEVYCPFDVCKFNYDTVCVCDVVELRRVVVVGHESKLFLECTSIKKHEEESE